MDSGIITVVVVYHWPVLPLIYVGPISILSSVCVLGSVSVLYFCSITSYITMSIGFSLYFIPTYNWDREVSFC